MGGWIGSLLSGDCYRMNKVEEVICVQSLSYAAFLFRSLQEGSSGRNESFLPVPP